MHRMLPANNLIRVGIFYDGMYFKHVSDYYNFSHQRKSRISITGLHRFIREQIAQKEGIHRDYCRIVDAHYFRGRLSATEADERNLLLNERRFEDVLMREAVTTHFLPIQTSHGEKGIDVWFSLEAFELAIYKRYDICVLITGDADYLPLVRKLNSLGTRVMLIAWDFKYTDHHGKEKQTRTSQQLIDEVTYPIMMSEVIDDRSKLDDVVINSIFLTQTNPRHTKTSTDHQKEVKTGKIVTLNAGYGFIRPSGASENVFFHYSEVFDGDFNHLRKDDSVEFRISPYLPEDGTPPPAIRVRKV